MRIVIAIALALVACAADEKPTSSDLGFDGTCVNCHAGLSSGHVHVNYKLKCVDCHGGNDLADVPENAFTDPVLYRDPARIAASHVRPKVAGLARFFFANGIDDNGDGQVDEVAVLDAAKDHLDSPGEVFEPQLHGEGPGEFVDTELQRDLNYTRFLNPGDLRVATATCGSRAGAGSSTGCHQETVDIVRRSIMVNQSAVINGAYYGNESWRKEFIDARGSQMDPRSGAFGYALDYDGVDQCITSNPTHFDSSCLEARATSQDPAVAAGAPGNARLPAFEMAQGTIKPASESTPGTGAVQMGAGFTRYPWGGQMDDPAAERPQLAAVPNGTVPGTALPDPVDVVLRTFRAYYPLNYPGSTLNFQNTFGTSILPEAKRFATNDPFGRGHSSGCSACHAPYSYDGSRQPTQVQQDDGTVVAVTDPTTKHRELDPATQDRGMVGGVDHLLGRAVKAAEQIADNRPQQKTYSMAHSMTTKIDTDACGLCHGFVTRINNAYQGFAEEEQRDQLARRAPIAFTTPIGTKVRILDSWVREDNAIASGSTVVIPEGVAIVDLAKKRDADLAKQGFVAGNGGCAQATFTEDCNNNGELDHGLVLTQVDEAGNVIKTVTIDEDLNNNGALDLIDRLPREKSVDGRQMRYIYGGRNGSTRQMDVHFERGMHCIDCHFLQDVHGDGHVYSTNWDAIEIECEDCHGGKARSNLKTSGPNGGNSLTAAHDDSGVPYFEDKGGAIVQRSRVTPGVFWKVPQAIDDTSGLATEAHAKHAADPKEGSTFAGTQGSSPITAAKLECATCHSSWVHNCMGCHIDLNVGDKQRNTVQADGVTVAPSAGENEVWLSNANNPGHVNFQLLGLLRAPFVLGVTSKAEGGRLATFRSSMQAHVTVTDANGNTAIDNATFTTFQTVDANSGRVNVATSGVAMNQTMPHTVRPKEARGCEMCHSLVAPTGAVRNEHILAETYGLGTGAYPFVGDWAMAAGAGGIELFEHKQEHELAAQKGASNRFPGLIVNPNDRIAAKVEPIFDGTAGIAAGAVANDIVLVRNFDPTPAVGQPSIPTLKDLAILAVDAAGAGKLVVSEITARGNPSSARPSIGDATHSFVLALPAPPLGLAHLSPDVSDPFVYVADGAAGVSVVELLAPPNASTPAAKLVGTTPIAGKTATAVALAGDFLYVGTDGTIETFSIADPRSPVLVSTTSIGFTVSSLKVEGFVLYIGLQSSELVSASLADPGHPSKHAGAPVLLTTPGTITDVKGMAVSQGHVYVASGPLGVFDVDMRTPAAPGPTVNLSQQLAPGQAIDAVDVVVSVLPGQTWLLVLDASGDLWGLKLDNRKSVKERCFPDTSKCALDMSFLDQTIMGRDPSFDPNANAFISPADPNPLIADPSAGTVVAGVVQPFFHQARTILAGGKRLAPPAQWEQIGTLTGRRMRDSFMPGAGVLSLSVMQAMRAVKVCESSAPSTTANGLGALGYDDGSGTCTPLGTSANTALKPCASIAAGGCAFHRVSRTR